MTAVQTHVLLVAEYIDEVKHLARRYGDALLRDPATTVLAFEPGLQAYLKHQGIRYLNTCEFFDANSHGELASVSEELIPVIRTGLEIHDEFGASSGYERACVFFVRFFLHHLLFLTHVVHRAVVTLEPDRVIVAEAPASVSFNSGVAPGERYLAEAVRAVCQEQGIVCETSQLPSRLAVIWVSHLRRAIKAAAVRVLFGAVDALLARRRRGKILVMASSKAYNLGHVLAELRPMLGLRYRPVYLWSNDLPSLLKQFVRDTREWSYPGLRPRIAANHGFASVLDAQLARLAARLVASRRFSYCGLDLARMVNQRTRTTLRPLLLEVHAQTARLDWLLDEHRPDLIVSQAAAGWTANLGTLAARKGIPAMLIPHGSMVPSTGRHALAEWRDQGLTMTHSDYAYVAVQTPLTEAYLKQSPGASRAIRTGPLLFARPERPTAAPSPGDKLLIHVGTPKTSRSLRFWTYETVDEYVNNVNSLIRAVDEVDGCRLLIRFRAVQGLTEDAFRALLARSACYEICAGGSLADYLGLADLLVSYSSTAIEEALQLQIPVLQYDPQGKYCHVTGRVLDPSAEPHVGSCYFVAAEAHLTWALRWLLTNHLASPQPHSLWDEHRFTRADGLRSFLETIGLVSSAGRPGTKKPAPELRRAAWIRS